MQPHIFAKRQDSSGSYKIPGNPYMENVQLCARHVNHFRYRYNDFQEISTQKTLSLGVAIQRIENPDYGPGHPNSNPIEPERHYTSRIVSPKQNAIIRSCKESLTEGGVRRVRVSIESKLLIYLNNYALSVLWFIIDCVWFGDGCFLPRACASKSLQS